MPKSCTEFAAASLPPTQRLALSIREFCEAHGISEGFFYKLKKQGEGPREMKVGARTLITLNLRRSGAAHGKISTGKTAAGSAIDLHPTPRRAPNASATGYRDADPSPRFRPR